MKNVIIHVGSLTGCSLRYPQSHRWPLVQKRSAIYNGEGGNADHLESQRQVIVVYKPRRKFDSLIAFRRASRALLVTSWRLSRPAVASEKASSEGASRL